MSQIENVREPSIIREEIHDLREYLDGLPSSIKHGNASAAYHSRLDELQKELANDLQQWHGQKMPRTSEA